MKSNKSFSLIELMTVILVILLLISLLIPTFSMVKKNARSALCKSQMRQISVLFTSYMTDYGGYLPNDRSLDNNTLLEKWWRNKEFYANWNGHLLPYLDTDIKSYNRKSKLRSDGSVVTHVEVTDIDSIKPDDPFEGGWVLIKDAFDKGGFNELKVFICPEIHANTYDVGAARSFNDIRIPRITNMTSWNGFPTMGANFVTGGVPTTYVANDVFFGLDSFWRPPANSKRMDEIAGVSQKAFLVEGGCAWGNESAYWSLSQGDLGANITPEGNGIWKNNTMNHKLNYVHDNYETFWIMNCQLYQYFPSMWWSMEPKTEIAIKFNNTFTGKAMMVQCNFGYSIFSFIDPAEKPFDKFFLANPPGTTLLPFTLFDEPEFQYLTGNMNVLFGDGSVSKKDQAWLSINRNLIGQITKE